MVFNKSNYKKYENICYFHILYKVTTEDEPFKLVTADLFNEASNGCFLLRHVKIYKNSKHNYLVLQREMKTRWE